MAGFAIPGLMPLGYPLYESEKSVNPINLQVTGGEALNHDIALTEDEATKDFVIQVWFHTRQPVPDGHFTVTKGEGGLKLEADASVFLEARQSQFQFVIYTEDNGALTEWKRGTILYNHVPIELSEEA